MDQFLSRHGFADFTGTDNTLSSPLAHAAVSDGRFLDAYRYLYPAKEKAFTNWCSATSARQLNYGQRIDYILVDVGLKGLLVDCVIAQDVHGSDHCPVVVQLECLCVAATTSPPLNTIFMPEFQGRQQKLESFLIQDSAFAHSVEICPRDKSDTMVSEVYAGVSQTPISHVPTCSSSPCCKERHLQEFSVFQTGVTKHGGKDGHSSRKHSYKNTVLKDGGIKKICVHEKQVSIVTFLHKAAVSNEGSVVGDRARVNIVHNQENCEETTGSIPTNTDPLVASSKCTDSPGKHVLARKSISCSGKFTLDNKSLHPQTWELNSTQATADNASDMGGDNGDAGAAWKSLLSGPPPPPLCNVHQHPCILRTVKKAGVNKGRRFYVCSHPDGPSNNKQSRCRYFQWVEYSSRTSCRRSNASKTRCPVNGNLDL